VNSDNHTAVNAPADGVIKFDLSHQTGSLPTSASTASIFQWFGICRALDLIGQHSDRYEGAAYGNISQRASEGFLITGTQTGGHNSIGDGDIAWVTAFDTRANQVISKGPSRPSSESLSHGQVYALLPQVRFVIHVHSPLIWHRTGALGLPGTHPDAAYGTPEMAAEVERLLNTRETAEQGIFTMGGHEDGIVTFGATPEQAGHRLLQLYRRACELRP